MSGACMPARRVVHLLLLTANPDLVELYRQHCPECVVTIAVDAVSAFLEAPMPRSSSVTIVLRKDWVHELIVLSDVLDSMPPLVLATAAAFLLRETEPVRD